MLKIRKRMDISKLYNIDKIRFVKCKHCIHYKFIDFIGLMACKFQRKILNRDIALGCPYFKTKGGESDED